MEQGIYISFPFKINLVKKFAKTSWPGLLEIQHVQLHGSNNIN